MDTTVPLWNVSHFNFFGYWSRTKPLPCKTQFALRYFVAQIAELQSVVPWKVRASEQSQDL